MDNLLKELETINNVLDAMKDWCYWTDEDVAMERELKKRKSLLEFLIENA